LITVPYWKIIFNLSYAHLVITTGSEMEAYRYVKSVRLGSPRSFLSEWQPPSVRFITDEEGLFIEYPETAQPYLRDNDFTKYKGAIVLNARAVRVLSPLMGDAVELLPLQCEEGEFWLLNVLQCWTASTVSAPSSPIGRTATLKVRVTMSFKRAAWRANIFSG
jgi:hypothetical protein